MSSEILVVLLTAVAILLTAPLITMIRRAEEKRDDAWRRLAERHRLRYGKNDGEHKVPSVFGELDGREFLLTRVNENNNQVVSCTLELHGDLPAGLTLEKNVYGSGWVRRTFTKAADTGNGDFDRQVLARGNDAEEVRRYLTPERREATRELVELGGKVADGELQLPNPDGSTELEKLDGHLQTLIRLASLLDGRVPRPRASDRSLAARPDPDR